MSKILFITPRFPYPPLKGDQVRAYHHIRSLSSTHETFLVSLIDRSVSSIETKKLEKLCHDVKVINISHAKAYLRAIYGFFVKGKSLNESYFQEPGLIETVSEMTHAVQPDVVHCLTVRVAPALSTVPDEIASVDFIDSLSLNLKRRAEQAIPLLRSVWEIESRRMRALEDEIIGQVNHKFITSEIDRDHLTHDIPDDNIVVVPNGVDTDVFEFGPMVNREDNLLVFTGNLTYKPNIKSVKYFARSIFPIIRKRNPEVRFQIAGADPVASIRNLDKVDGIEVLGFVDSMPDVLQNATVSVCPLKSGTGIQNKVLEAMASGTPVVASSLAVAGISEGVAGEHYLQADEPEEFADHVLRLIEDEDYRSRLAQAARCFIEQNYRWSSTVERLDRTFRNMM